jgi:hypothetical protein
MDLARPECHGYWPEWRHIWPTWSGAMNPTPTLDGPRVEPDPSTPQNFLEHKDLVSGIHPWIIHSELDVKQVVSLTWLGMPMESSPSNVYFRRAFFVSFFPLVTKEKKEEKSSTIDIRHVEIHHEHTVTSPVGLHSLHTWNYSANCSHAGIILSITCNLGYKFTNSEIQLYQFCSLFHKSRDSAESWDFPGTKLFLFLA